MNINELKEILEKSKSLSDLSRAIFNKVNYTNNEKCKKILSENGVDWREWLETKKIEKPKIFCLYCGKEIISKDSRRKFCNQSCAASYNNLKRSKNCEKIKNKYCLNCGKELNIHQNVFCCSECSFEYKHKEYIKLWKTGEKNGMSGPDGISKTIRKYLFEKYNNKCQLCGWGEENPHTHKVPLQIHHIDGDCTNNKEENLQLLCPNCHSLTETFGAGNKNKSKRVDRRSKYYKEEIEADKNKDVREVARCIVCGKKLEGDQITFCSQNCKNRYQTKNITKEQILNVFYNTKGITFKMVAEKLNISTSCLRNKCKKFGILTEIQKIRYNI